MKKILIIIGLCISFFMVIFDATVVNIVIPSIANQFHATVSDLQWMMAAYMLSFSSLLLLAGYLVDRYGAKKIMLLGLAGFVLASLGCALTQSAPQLIVCRFLQGITGSALIPASLTLINSSYRDKKSNVAHVYHPLFLATGIELNFYH